jgi:ADP-ribosyl-[dinitrogen reductase] hydrolase
MTPTPHTTIDDRVLGGLLGEAVGDALGATLEFGRARPRTNWHTEITGGGPYHWAPGQSIDDTDLTLAVADTYATGYTLQGVADRFLAWQQA